MAKELEVIVEFGVCGYYAKKQTFLGESKDVVEAIKKSKNEFYDEVSESQEKNGDLRTYTPMFANGYLSIPFPFDLEWGEDLELTILEMNVVDGESKEPIPYHSKFAQKFRAMAE